MKTQLKLLIVAIQLVTAGKAFSQNIAINSTGNLPDTSAMLDVSSTVKGFLAPRMTTTERNAIVLPATGLLIYNNTTNAFNVNTGTAGSPSWTVIASAGSSGWGLTGNSGTSASSNFVGTTDAVDVVVKTNNSERMRILSGGNVGINTNNAGSTLDVKGTLRLSGSSSGYVGFAPASSAGSATYTLPSADGSNGQQLTTNGSGTLSWAAAGGSGSGWGLTGNSGTNGSTNYIGTSDNQTLTFKANNTKSGYIGIYDYATSFGMNANAVYQSTAIGYNAQATGANFSTAMGYNSVASSQGAVALGASTQAKGGNNAVAIGNSSVAGYTDAIAIGNGAAAASGGTYNETIAIGSGSTSNSYQSIAIGKSASATSNNQTLAVGVSASATGAQATAIGNGASASAQNSTAIGNGASVSNANYISIGNTSVTAIRGQVNFTTYSDGRFKKNIKENVHGLDFIMKLRPVTYTWDIHKFNEHARGNDYEVYNVAYNETDEEAIAAKEKITYTGFIAQEVEQAAVKSHFNFSGVLKPVDYKDAYSLSYSEFVVPLVKATQELNKKLTEQEKMIEELMKEVKELKKQKNKKNN